MPVLDRPILPTEKARAVLAAADDALARAGISLLLLAGLRPGEVEALRIADYTPDPEEPRLHIGTDRHPRTIRIAPSAAASLDAYLATQTAAPEDFLLPELPTPRLIQMVRRTAEAAGVEAGVHDLRRAAVAAVLEDGTPVRHVEAYFGMAKPPRPKDLLALPGDYDAAIAGVLERVSVPTGG